MPEAVTFGDLLAKMQCQQVCFVKHGQRTAALPMSRPTDMLPRLHACATESGRRHCLLDRVKTTWRSELHYSSREAQRRRLFTSRVHGRCIRGARTELDAL